MKYASYLLLLFLALAGCEPQLVAPEDDNVRLIKYEVSGNAELAIIEYLNGEGQALGTGITSVPWSRAFDMDVGERLYLSAWSSESGGGSVTIKVFVDGKLFREANSLTGERRRISGNAF